MKHQKNSKEIYDCNEHAVLTYEVPNYRVLLQNLRFAQMKSKLMTTERSLQLYIIPQDVLTTSDPNVPSLFLCRTLLTVASWPILYILYTMEENSSWEAERSSASEEILRILWNPKVYFCTYKSPVPCPLQHFFKIHFNITSHLRLGLSSGLFPSDFLTINIFFQIPDLNFARNYYYYYYYSHAWYKPTPTPPHFILLLRTA